jgi:uncharacterized protein YaiE (UPF0345 family)
MAYADALRVTSPQPTMGDVADLIDGCFSVVTGWVPITGTFTRASATTITVSSGALGIYNPGDKLTLTDTTGKYFYVVGVADTTLTVTGGSDYSLVGTISAGYYSKTLNPLGFPQWFNWSPTFTGFSANPTGGIYRFTVLGRKCTVHFNQPNNGTSNATGYTATAPVSAVTITNGLWQTGIPYLVDNGAASVDTGRARIPSASNIITILPNSGSWTAANGKSANFTLEYEV